MHLLCIVIIRRLLDLVGLVKCCLGTTKRDVDVYGEMRWSKTVFLFYNWKYNFSECTSELKGIEIDKCLLGCVVFSHYCELYNFALASSKMRGQEVRLC